MRPTGTHARGKVPKRSLVRWLPPALVVAALSAFFALGLGRYLTFQSLAGHREWLLQWVQRLGVLAPLAFISIYAAAVAVSIPVGIIVTLAGGFLFGTWLGGLYSLIAATLGSAAIFLIASTSLGDLLRQRALPSLRKVEAGFQENAASYLLVLRLVPIFPFWLVNLLPAFFGMRLRTFVAVSFIGMAPASFVYSSLGAGLGSIIDAGQAPDLQIILRWTVLGPLIALSALALVPVIYKRHKARQRDAR
ncbi:MAG TPA: TVP38/TMEM64 family protein [Stellaceae bacterium]|nr:TVP38/TMEM64 family protein [Stellaceae bacterium]